MRPVSRSCFTTTCKERIREERLRVVLAANAALVLLYWDIRFDFLGTAASSDPRSAERRAHRLHDSGQAEQPTSEISDHAGRASGTRGSGQMSHSRYAESSLVRRPPPIQYLSRCAWRSVACISGGIVHRRDRLIAVRLDHGPQPNALTAWPTASAQYFRYSEYLLWFAPLRSIARCSHATDACRVRSRPDHPARHNP